jgi:hypothetical protein
VIFAFLACHAPQCIEVKKNNFHRKFLCSSKNNNKKSCQCATEDEEKKEMHYEGNVRSLKIKEEYY